MHKVARQSEPGQIKGYRQGLSFRIFDLLSHRQGRCIALPVPLSPAVLHEVEGELIVCLALWFVCVLHDDLDRATICAGLFYPR
jgi:hypothetical protein